MTCASLRTASYRLLILPAASLGNFEPGLYRKSLMASLVISNIAMPSSWHMAMCLKLRSKGTITCNSSRKGQASVWHVVEVLCLLSCDAVQCNVAQCSTSNVSVLHCSALRRNAVYLGSLKRKAVQCVVFLCSTMLCNVLQYLAKALMVS